jgi:hypothetical protein
VIDMKLPFSFGNRHSAIGNPRPPAVEPLEARALCSGNDSIWIDLGSPVMPRASTTDGLSTTIMVSEGTSQSSPSATRYASPRTYQILSAGRDG